MPDDLQIVMKAQDILKKSDFESSFKKVLELLIAMEKRNSQAIADLQKAHEAMLNQMQSNHASNYAELKGKVNDVFVGEQISRMKTEHLGRIKILDERVRRVKDGKTPTMDELLVLIKPLIPQPVPGKAGKDIDGVALKALTQKITDMEENIKKIPRGKLGMRKVPIIRAINLTDQVNGVVTTFTLPRDTVRVLGIFSTQFPITFDAANDFSFAGTTLTVNTPTVQSGQTLWALCEHLFYA